MHAETGFMPRQLFVSIDKVVLQWMPSSLGFADIEGNGGIGQLSYAFVCLLKMQPFDHVGKRAEP